MSRTMTLAGILLALGCATAISAIDYSRPDSVPVLNHYTVSWIGNTFGQSGRREGKWVQNQIFALYATPEGVVYANSPWDEGGRECGIYKDGQVVGKLADTHSVLAGYAITGDDKYIYAGFKNGFVRRYFPDGKPAKFPGGKRDGSYLPVGGKIEGPAGLAIVGDELFVSVQGPDQIVVFDRHSLARKRDWSLPGCRQMVADKSGRLWIIQAADKDHPARVVGMQTDGKSTDLSIGDAVAPSALALNAQGQLLVADNGPDQYVRIYDLIAAPRQVGTLGERGGVFAGSADQRGRMGPLRFYGITALACDARGNIYVNSNGWSWSGTDLRAFTPEGRLLWQLQGLFFVDLVDADPANPKEVFGVQERFTVAYDAPPGQGWTHEDYTLDPFRYPHDPRVLGHKGSSVRVLNLQGKRFLAISDMDGSWLWIYRMDGRIAVPTACFASAGAGAKIPHAPATARWFWRDANGDGDFQPEEFTVLGAQRDGIAGLLDERGDYWQPTWGEHIRRYAFTGLDERGVPVYNLEQVAVEKCPDDFSDMERLEYIAATDTMYISGYTPNWPKQDKYYIPAGRAIAAYPDWSRGNRKAKWMTQLPYEGKSNRIAKAMSIAGDYVFVNYFNAEQIVVIDNRSGALIGRMVPTAAINNEHGDADIPWAVKAIRRPDGSYVVFVEDDRYAKVVLYRWKPE